MQFIWLISTISFLSFIFNVSAIPSGGSSINGSQNPKGSKLRTVSVIGAGVFSAEQLEKLSVKFAKENLTYNFDEWNDWREAEGFLCRNDTDCWVDTTMECVDYELQFTPSVSCTMKPNILNLKQFSNF